MSLYSKWNDLIAEERDQEAYDAFWGEYLPKEQTIYEDILENKDAPINGTLGELAKKYDMTNHVFAGFMDGINTSLKQSVTLEKLTRNSEITLDVDFEKLYYNMLAAKAEWLYTLPEWSNILTDDQRKDIKKEYNKSKIIVKDKKIGRNDPCPCGSGKKYKQCCLNK